MSNNATATLTVGSSGVSDGQSYVGGTAPANYVGNYIWPTSDPFAIQVVGDYAYVTYYASGYLEILDISNPGYPVEVGQVVIGTVSTPTGLYVSGRYAYLTSAYDSTLWIANVSNPSNPLVVSDIGTGTILHPNSIYVQGRYAI